MFVQASALAKDDKTVLANANDVVAPVVMKTENPDEVNVGAFSFTPNDKLDPQALTKLRAELLKMEKDLLMASKNVESNSFNFNTVGATTAQITELLALQNLEASIKAQRLEILNQKRLASLEKQAQIYKTTQNADEKIKS